LNRDFPTIKTLSLFQEAVIRAEARAETNREGSSGGEFRARDGTGGGAGIRIDAEAQEITGPQQDRLGQLKPDGGGKGGDWSLSHDLLRKRHQERLGVPGEEQKNPP
jgi:hypothetical protein